MVTALKTGVDPTYVFCCGGDGSCAGSCECQCHALVAERDRLRAGILAEAEITESELTRNALLSLAGTA